MMMYQVQNLMMMYQVQNLMMMYQVQKRLQVWEHFSSFCIKCSNNFDVVHFYATFTFKIYIKFTLILHNLIHRAG